jgi:hypothetical protein
MGIIDFILAGRLFGRSGGDGSYDEGFAEGKKAEHDAFWDAYQKNGTRTNYYWAFYGDGWTDDTFKPKYDIKATLYGCSMFSATTITDLSESLKIAGIKLDTSEMIDATSMFNASKTRTIPELDFSNVTVNSSTVFANSNVVEIEKLILSDVIAGFQNWFMLASKLATITIAGVISKSISFQWSPLSVDSMKSIITHLKDYSADGVNAFQHTLTFATACWTSLEADSTSPNGGTWKEYVEDLGWNTN